MSRSILLVANPTAQSGKNAARIARAEKLFASHGVTTELLATLPAGKTIDAVRDRLRAAPVETIVAMGGDGTFREVAAGVLDSGLAERIPMGMLPSGTANDQGRSFGLFADDAALEHNVDVVCAAHETRLDAGRARALDDAGHELATAWFFDSLGWGISARVLAQRNEDRELVQKTEILRDVYRDKLVYAGALLRVFLESYVVDDEFEVVATVGTEKTELGAVTDLIVKATRIYGGAWVFDRTSRHDDGLFEVVPFRGKRDWTSKAIVDLDGNPVTEEMLNAIGIEHSHPFRVARVELSFTPPRGGAPLAAQVDGEEWIASPRASIEVVPRALRLIVPVT